MSLLKLDLFCNGRGILTTITLTKYEQGTMSLNSCHLEAAISVVVKFIQGYPEIFSNLIHVLAVWAGMIRVSIAQTSTNRLVYKNHIVIMNPTMLVLVNLPRRHVCRLDKNRAKLHKVAQLTG